jgi:hypothetical protein
VDGPARDRRRRDRGDAVGLTAGPVARRLGVTRPERTRPLLVGGQAWVIDLACRLKSAGLDVLLWAGFDEERDRIRQAGLELAPGELLAAATGRGAQLENINAVLLLTNEDDFNALACTVLEGTLDGPVYRLGPRLPSHGVVAPFSGGQILFGKSLTRYDIGQRYAVGAQIVNPAGRGSAIGSTAGNKHVTRSVLAWISGCEPTWRARRRRLLR